MKILVMRGDGIGPEITDATMTVVNEVNGKLGLGLEFVEAPVGLEALQAHGTTIPDDTYELCEQLDGIIMGPVDTFAYPPKEEGGINPSARLRTGLELYANMRPARTRKGIKAVVDDMDLVIARENTEGFYADRNMLGGTGSEFAIVEGIGVSIRKITAAGSRRIVEAAFRAAGRRRRKVTAVHKANVMKLTDGIFLKEARAVAAARPDFEYDELIVDAAAAWLVREPSRFDVIVTTNMFGDILSDEASELAGSLGLAPSINAGDKHCLAQAQHGSAPDIAGKGIANPTSLMLSVAMMFDWLGDRHGDKKLLRAGEMISAAVDQALENPANHTPDLGGNGNTAAFTEQVMAGVKAV